MMLKMISAPRSGQADMVVQTRFGIRIFELGKIEEMGDEEAADILGGQFGKCFERAAAPKLTPQAKAAVHAARVTVKPPPGVAEDDAAEEATKMVSSKDYKVK